MNYEQARKASKWNPVGVMKVLGGLEIECPECKGIGTVPAYGVRGSCPTCHSRQKIPYSWTPQVGEWCIWKENIEHIVDIDILSNDDFTLYFDYISDLDCYFDFDNRRASVSKATPILEWQVIEEVLEKAGLKLKLRFTSQQEWFALIIGDRCEVAGIGKSRQEAVMKAVLELGKEMK